MMAMLATSNRPLSEVLNAVSLSDNNFSVLGISTHRIYAHNWFIKMYNYLYYTCYVHHVQLSVYRKVKVRH